MLRLAPLVVALAAATIVVGSPGAAAGRQHAVAADAGYYVLLLTNVEDNVYVGTETSLQGVNACDLPDGGPSPCSDPVTYTAELGPYTTCAAATAAYNAAAMDPHPAFGGTKVYIFGGSYFIDDMSSWCVPGSDTTTTTTTTTSTTMTTSTSSAGTTTTTTTTTTPSSGSLVLPTRFCAVGAAAASAPAPLCAPRKTLSPEQKADARNDLVGEAYAAGIFCAEPSGVLSKGHLTSSGAQFAVEAFYFACPVVLQMMIETLVQIHDPPAAAYGQLVLLAPIAPTATPCPTGTGAAACAAVQPLLVKYASEVSLSDEVNVAEALTLDRFAAAVAANSAPAAYLQSAMAAVYAGTVGGQLTALRQAGAALAAALRAQGIDFDVPAAQDVPAITGPSSPVLSSALLAKLVAGGVAATPAAARQAAVTAFAGVHGTLDAASALTAQLPVSAFGAAFGAITLSDLDAIVKAMAAQGYVNATTKSSLVQDLTTARAACGKRPAFIAATTRFAATVNAAVQGQARVVLAIAIKPLTAASIPLASCA